MSKKLLPDIQAMQKHLDFLFKDSTTGKIEIAYTPVNSGAVNSADYFNHDETEKAARFAYEKNIQEGINVYVGAALRQNAVAPFGRSSLSDFLESHAVWCDLDDPNAAKEAKEKYKDLPPSLVVVTGRHPDLRAQVWWKLESPIAEHTELKKSLAQICYNLAGDKSVVDPARVMRLGGSIAWPKKPGRIPEKTEIKTPERGTQSVTLPALNSYFPAPPMPLTPAGGGVDHLYTPSPDSKNEWSIDQVCDMLNHIHPDSEYMDWISVGMALKDYGVSFDIWDAWSNKGTKYPGKQELLKKWQSFKGRGIGIGTLYYHAHNGGYHPSKYAQAKAQTLYKAQLQTQPQVEEFDPETGEIKQSQVGGLPLIFASDVSAVTDTSDFVEDVLRDNEFSVVYGESNCGKTFFMLDLAMHVALGKPWRNKQVEQGGVIYAALEGGHGTKNRIVAFREHYQIKEDIPLAIIPSNLNFLDVEGDIKKLVEAIQHAQTRLGKIRLIVIDTLARAISGGDENSSMDMGQLIINADILRSITGAHIAFVHHCGKDAAKGARGHSSLRAAVDTEIEISRDDTTSPSLIKIVKQREMEMIDDMAFSLSRIVLGVNGRGKEVSSCVVLPADPVERTKESLTPVQSFVYESLISALIDYGQVRNVVKNMPPVNCVRYDELRLAMEARGSKEFFATENKTTTEQVKSTTFTARAGLKKKGKINMTDGYIWAV